MFQYIRNGSKHNIWAHPKSTANSTDIAVLAVEGVIFKRNRAAGSICAAVELLRVDPCRFSGAPVRSSV